MLILDEVQNYLKEEIKVLQKCINPKTNSILYVGDLAQQTKLCTIRNWSEIDEDFEESRIARLNKVYRNTKEILEYIKSCNYEITIPEGLKSADNVVEKACLRPDEIANENLKNIKSDNKKNYKCIEL